MSEDFDKYLAIANHDIQRADNIGELKSYVASILYDNDKKVEIINNLHSIIKEVREYIEMHTDKLKATRIPKIDFNYKELLEILDKENK